MKIDDFTANVLANSAVEENRLYLPKMQLERKQYLAVNKVLAGIGGKWNRKAKAHIFEDCPEEVIEQILFTGEYTNQKKEFQFFETPEELAKEMIEMAEIKENETVLEPSAGRGQIAKHLAKCDCIELNEANRKYLIENGFNVVAEDFLTSGRRYDVIVANPPFTKQQDIDHVLHMIKCANRRVVSIMSAAVMFRDNKKTVAFRDCISELGGKINALPDKTFSQSGTNVRTCIVCVDV